MNNHPPTSVTVLMTATCSLTPEVSPERLSRFRDGELDGLGNSAVGTGVEVTGGGGTPGKANENAMHSFLETGLRPSPKK